MRNLDFSDGFESSSAPTSGTFPATSVSVTPTGSLASTTAQAGLVELQGDIDTINGKIGNSNGLATLDGSGKIPAAQIPALALVDVNVVANIAARDALTVQEGDVAVVTDAGSGVSKTYIYDGSGWIELLADGSLASHMSDSSGAHAASAISVSAIAGISGADAQAVLAEISGDVTDHVTDSAGAHAASAISFAPTASTVSTTVQAAIEEIQTQLDGVSGGFTDSMVRLHTGNGHGSTNTRIRRFTTTVTNTGSDITYADSAAGGASFTIVTTGVYAFTYTEEGNTGSPIFGITKNSSALNSDINSLAQSEILAISNVASGNARACVSWTGLLTAGDVIRPQTNNGGGNTFANNIQSFTAARVH